MSVSKRSRFLCALCWVLWAGSFNGVHAQALSVPSDPNSANGPSASGLLPPHSHVPSVGAEPKPKLLASPGAGSERNATSTDWRQANQAVAQFPRGHADVLRWEQNNAAHPPEAAAHPEAGQMGLERAVRLAWQGHVRWVKPGMSALEIAAVRQQAGALRWEVQKLWVDAVASRQSLAHSRDVLAVAQAGFELGQRMAQVGNWSRARQIQEELSLWEARSRASQAHALAERALLALWQRLGGGMTVQQVAQQLPLHLPMALPPAPAGDVAAWQAQALQAHGQWPLQDQHAQRLLSESGRNAERLKADQDALMASLAQDEGVWDPRPLKWGHNLENAWTAKQQADRLARQIQVDVSVAHRAFEDALQRAAHTQAAVMRLHTELSQETLWRYNGMLTSTWDLLASARIRIDSVDAALQAQRLAWVAHADLMAVLAGLPYAANVEALGPTRSTNNTAGH